MTDSHSVHDCRWGVPTIQLPWPFWYAAADDAWTCTCNGVPRILHDPDVCHACRRWTSRAGGTDAKPEGTCEFHHALVFRSGDDIEIPGVS